MDCGTDLPLSEVGDQLDAWKEAAWDQARPLGDKAGKTGGKSPAEAKDRT